MNAAENFCHFLDGYINFTPAVALNEAQLTFVRNRLNSVLHPPPVVPPNMPSGILTGNLIQINIPGGFSTGGYYPFPLGGTGTISITV